jgi:O-antigen/teichoic acid export membrane protein
VSDAPARGDEAAAPHSGRRLAEDATAAFGVQVLGYATGLVASILIARALGPTDRGVYAVAVTAVGLAVVLFHAGTELAGSYFFAERGTPLTALSRNGFLSAVLLGPVAMAAMLVLYGFTHATLFDGLSLGLLLCAAAAVPFQMHQLWLANLLMLGGRFRTYQRVSAVVAVAQVVVVAVVFASGAFDLTAALAIYLGVALVAWSLAAWGARPLGPIGPPYDLALLRATIGYGLRLHGGYIGWTVLLRVDLFLVALWLDARAAGIYAIAVVFGELAWQLTTPLVQAAVRPQMALPTEEAAGVSFLVARLNLLLSGAVALVFAATLWFLVPLLYGADYDGVYAATVVLLPGVVAMAAFRPLYTWLVRVASPVRLSVLCLALAALDVALNAVLLDPLGVEGASLASTVSYVLLLAATARWAALRSGIPLRTLVPTAEDVRTVARNLARIAGQLRGAGVRRIRGRLG